MTAEAGEVGVGCCSRQPGKRQLCRQPPRPGGGERGSPWRFQGSRGPADTSIWDFQLPEL